MLNVKIAGRHEGANDFGQCIAEFCMLIGIQVHAVNDTCRGDGLSVKESALKV